MRQQHVIHTLCCNTIHRGAATMNAQTRGREALCRHVAAVSLCWCGAHIYSGGAPKQSQQPRCSRSAGQVAPNVLTVHSRWLHLTKTYNCGAAPLPPLTHTHTPPLSVYTAASNKPSPGKAHTGSSRVELLTPEKRRSEGRGRSGIIYI